MDGFDVTVKWTLVFDPQTSNKAKIYQRINWPGRKTGDNYDKLTSWQLECLFYAMRNTANEIRQYLPKDWSPGAGADITP